MGKPISETTGGGLGVGLTADEGPPQERTGSLTEPPIRCSPDFDVSAWAGFEYQFGQNPIVLSTIEDPEAASLLPGKGLVPANGAEGWRDA